LPLIRFDLVRLHDADVQDLRDAYAAMYEISDTAPGDRRGYFAYARGHGYDLDLCHDDNRVFLTWHRSYAYSFEKALNSALQWKRGDTELELTLPYWDWTQFSTATHAPNGLPKVVNDETYINAAGDEVRNPLAQARSLYRSIALGLSDDDEFTKRYPTRLRADIPHLKDEVERYLTNPNFSAFQDDFNFAAHGNIHVVVGGSDPVSPLPRRIGDMGSTVSASYDPLFWMHHAMCDKVWADWQALWPSATVPQHVLDMVVYDGRVGRDLIDAENSLRYIYSENSVEAAVGALGTSDSAPAAALSAAASHVTEIKLGTVEAGFVRAELEFHKMRPPTESFELRAYIENPNCDPSTGYKDKSFAGRIVFFGHGTCPGAPGHCNPALGIRDAYDLRPKHPLRYDHTRYRLDITRGLRRYIGRKKSVKNLKVYLITLDDKGERVAPESLIYDQCSLRTYAKD
jgi:tyrosinase